MAAQAERKDREEREKARAESEKVGVFFMLHMELDKLASQMEEGGVGVSWGGTGIH